MPEYFADSKEFRKSFIISKILGCRSKLQERQNALCNISGEALWGFQSAMVMPATVLTVLLTQIGASKATVGLIPSLDGLSMFLPVFGVYFFRSHKKRKLRLVVFHYLTLTPFLALMGLSVLARDFIPLALLKVLLMVFLDALRGQQWRGEHKLDGLDLPFVSSGNSRRGHWFELGLFKPGRRRRSVDIRPLG